MTSFTPSCPTLNILMPARKSVQAYLISRSSKIPTFSKTHGGLHSRFPKAPCALLQSTRFLEREHQSRGHHRSIPDARFRPYGFGSEGVFRRTRCFHCLCEGRLDEQKKGTDSAVTYMPGRSWSVGYKVLSKPQGIEHYLDGILTLAKNRVSSSTKCEVNITRK